MRGREIGEDLKEKNGGVAAFFDLDGTLAALPSLERRFFRMLRYRKEIPVKSYFLWLGQAALLAPSGIGALLRANKMYLRGVQSLRPRGRGHGALPPWHTGSPKARGQGSAPPARRNPRLPLPVFFKGAMERLAWHGSERHTIVLLSGTLEPLAIHVAQTLDAVLAERGIFLSIRVVATRLEEVDGRWTGRILGEAMIGEAKARAAQRMAPDLGIDLARCYAYGDSTTDQWLLAAVGRPVAVNPSRKLERIARTHGWCVLHWEPERGVPAGKPPDRVGAEARGIAGSAFAKCNGGPHALRMVERVK